MKILLIAYECSPYRGSEWAVGWGRLLQAARVGTVHCIVSAASFTELQRAGQEGLVPANVQFHTPAPDGRMLRLERRPVLFDYNYAAYRHWHRLAFAQARQLHRLHGFHVAHQSTVCTFREPGYLCDLGVPFVWGPFGGTQNFPTSMLSVLPPIEAGRELARTLANRIMLRGSRHVRDAAYRASAVLAANSTALADMEQICSSAKLHRLLETGLHQVGEPDRNRWQRRVLDAEQGRPARPLRLLWSGQICARKALPVLLRALALIGERLPFELDVLGDGPMLRACQREAARIAPSNPVRFHGRIGLAKAVQWMQTADVFCFTSLRDTSDSMVLEAQAAGVPVLCFDHQGARDMVSHRSGIRIPVTTPAGATRDWAAAIRQLGDDPKRLLALSQAATANAREFLWSTNGDRVNALYRQISGGSAETNSVDPVRIASRPCKILIMPLTPGSADRRSASGASCVNPARAI